MNKIRKYQHSLTVCASTGTPIYQRRFWTRRNYRKACQRLGIITDCEVL